MEHFYTLQGEGFHQGRAAYFIRLGGCDVGCFWCDVKDSWDASKHPQYAVATIVDMATTAIAAEQKNTEVKPIIVITGGEPLMHDLTTLTQAFQQLGFETNIETSGSSPMSGSWDWVCLSPKKFKAPLPEVLPLANELKVVIYNKTDFEWAEQFAAQVSKHCKLYLQPEWDKRDAVLPLIINYIKANPQWRLSAQVHKYISVP
ncbi:MAG TPA: 7-carboxy-7-deazaguanine synthase QueE [Chitinophagaceae bacterium]|nr:7-carboxy-7-deazaguanine synthase QueE [Chitinophagaceae bacterium]HAN40284.1 7-carboxy-7-deazaguanine synthase QueE [Chitinophagaceae bacterium]